MDKALLPRITVAPKGSFFLFGARGVGKSTLRFGGIPLVVASEDRGATLAAHAGGN